MRVLVIDSEVSNLRSVVTALRQLSCLVEVISTSAQLWQYITTHELTTASSHRSSSPVKPRRRPLPPLIFPGVGEARSAMESLARRGLDTAIGEFIAIGGVVLGICVGAQLMLQRSEERNARGMGITRGISRRLEGRTGDGKQLKIPHIGWNTVRFRTASPLFYGISQQSAFYFVHSYCVDPALTGERIAWTEYGASISVAYSIGNRIFGVQFHPEKSGPVGLRLIANFIRHSSAITE